MRLRRTTISIIVTISLLVWPYYVCGQDKTSDYVTLKIGRYTPTGDFDDAQFDSSGNLELMYGHYVNENFALEGGLVFFHSEGDDAPGYYDRDLTSSGLLVTAKAIYPTGRFEYYGGGGIGIYLPRLELYPMSQPATDESDVTAGVHALIGLNFNATEYWYLGIEGKYLWTDEADFNGIAVDIDGRVLTLNIGLRF
ncbi:MAG TPA: hypothetical protein DCO77_00600 [Nitrospiraceae bacterium]|nr:hypothetical protein [Nitrospiraceae bacterium]